MQHIDIVLLCVLAAIVCAAGAYIRHAKKKGQKCVGCPHSATCGKTSCCNTPQD